MPNVNQMNEALQQGAAARAQVDAELLTAESNLPAPPPRPNQPSPPENSTATGRLFSEAFGEDDQAASTAGPPPVTVIDSCVGQCVNAVAADESVQRVTTDATHAGVQVAAPTNPMSRRAAVSQQRRRQRRRRSY